MYADYLTEKTLDYIIETDKGFATYRYLDDGKTVYIIDIFVLPEFRKSGAAIAMADDICVEARKMGCSELIGSVVPSNKGSTISLKVLLGYDMSLKSASNDFIIFSKEI